MSQQADIEKEEGVLDALSEIAASEWSFLLFLFASISGFVLGRERQTWAMKGRLDALEAQHEKLTNQVDRLDRDATADARTLGAIEASLKSIHASLEELHTAMRGKQDK